MYESTEWFDKVEAAVLASYRTVKPRGDVDQSVLAGFLLEDNKTKDLDVIALGTGTKIMSGDERRKNIGFGPIFVHDSHAEILAHRGLQRWLWNLVKRNKCSLLVGKSLHFYCSMPPCGDCCVHEVAGGVSVQTGSKPFGYNQDQLKNTPCNVVRGKPGRGSPSQSVSCSDKICLWLNAGLQGNLLSNFITNEQLKLSTLCIGGANLESCRRAFYTRVGNVAKSNPLIVTGESKWKGVVDVPSSCSFVWWEGSQNGELLIGRTGKKLGVINKDQLLPRSWPLVCDANMIACYLEKTGEKAKSFGEIKRSNGSSLYRQRKKLITDKLCAYGMRWCEKYADEKKWSYTAM